MDKVMDPTERCTILSRCFSDLPYRVNKETSAQGGPRTCPRPPNLVVAALTPELNSPVSA